MSMARRDRDGEEFLLRHDDAHLRITQYLGTSGIHVVSFTGIGWEMGGIQTEEFRRSLTHAGQRHAATYVIDKTKSWFNATADDITTILREQTAAARRVVTLGNSMGGFGAAYFSSLLPNCDRAIAFAPQFAVSPGFMPQKEYRWGALRAAITDHRIDHALTTLAPGRRCFLFCGAGSGLDRAHAERLKAFGGDAVAAFLIQGGRHDVAAQLKASGCLHALLDCIIQRDACEAADVQALLAAHGVACETL
jgi:pimeloyl-ACP methyl ester carboxylesterase